MKSYIIHIGFVFFVTISLIFTNGISAQMTINTSFSPQQMVYNCLSTHFDYFGNVSYSGQYSATGNSQIGYFTNSTASNLGLYNGLVISTGDVNAIPGAANNLLSQSCSVNSDSDLVALFGNDYLDAVSFEYDFSDYSNAISYRIIFASEEYNQMVCNPDIDAFAVILTGPGLPPEGVNIAKVSGTSFNIGINSINNGSAGPGLSNDSCESLGNSTYFIQNWPTGTLVGFDGFTTVIDIIYPIIPCETYHVKFVLADAPDNNFDSGVFIEEKWAFSCIPYFETTLSNYSGDTIPESNGSATITLNMLCQHSIDLYEPVYISGDAVNDIDYSHVADSIYIPAGSQYGTFTINPINDGIPENAESVIISYQQNCTNFQIDTIWIADDDSITGSALIKVSERKLSIYPIPANGSFYTNAADGTPWRIYDMTGRLVRTGFVRKRIVNADGIESGLYTFITEKDGSSVKLIIE